MKFSKIIALTAALLSVLGMEAQEIRFVNAEQFPVFGKCVENTTGRYERLTPETAAKVRPELAYLGTYSSGLYVRFRSDSKQIHAHWTSTYGASLNVQALTGTRGLDLYALVDGKWRSVNSAQPDPSSKETTAAIVTGMDGNMREYMLYLSLYDGVSALEIGVEEGSEISAPQVDSPRSIRPIVMYGTSILMGGVASRPGMAFTKILERRFNREVIALGFSGNAFLDYEIAEQMALVKDPAVFVLDYVPNASVQQIEERAEKFFTIIRDAHPDVPIILVEDPQFTHSFFDAGIREEVSSKNKAQRAFYESLKKKGVKNIYYVDNKRLIGTDGEATVDGIHNSNLGMMRMADAMTPVLKKVLKKQSCL